MDGSLSVGRRLVRGASHSFIVRATGMAAALGAHALVARLTGVESYGTYFYALTVINIVSLGAKFGLDAATLRFVPTYWSASDWPHVRGFLRRAHQMAWAGSLVLGVLTTLVVFFARGRLAAELTATFYIACGVLLLTVLIQVRSSALQALKKIAQSQIPPELIRPVVLAAGVAIAIPLLQMEASALTAMTVEFVSLAVGLTVTNVLLARNLGEVRHGAAEYETGTWVRTAVPLSLMSGLVLVMNQTAVVAVGVLAGTTEAGIFGVAMRISSLISFGLRAVNSIAAPMISELHSQNRKRELQRMISIGAVGLLGFSVLAGTGIIVLGRFILSLFGPEFTDGYWALVILVIGQLVNTLAGPTGFLMTMTGHQNMAARLTGIAVTVNLVLSVSLIPAWGIVGAAVASCSAITCWNLLMYWQIRRRLDLDPTILGFLRRRSS